MKIIDGIKKRFNIKWRENESEAPLAKNFLQRMQALCNALPNGEALVNIDNGEICLRMTWTPQGQDVKERQTFALNGDGKAVVFKYEKGAEEDYEGKEEKKAQKESTVKELNNFMKEHYAFRFNLLTEQTECARTDTDNSHLIYMPADQRTLNGICLAAMDKGICCWDRDVKRYVESDRVETYHPFRQYFDTLPQWDGHDRVTELAHRISDDEVWTNAFHRWMLGMAAQWMGTDFGQRANSIAPILVSPRQGLGKSTFCRLLMPTELSRYFTENYDLNAQSQAEQKLATFGLINIDEFDKLSPRKMPLLKNLMQTERLSIRRAYKHDSEPSPRIASFIGTSNRRDLLTDLTGSRRFVCVEIDHQIDCSPLDHKQLYAQLKQELATGERHWLTKDEEAEIEKRNSLFYRHSPAEEVFSTTFRMAEENETGARLMTAAEIYAEMKRRNPAAMRSISCSAFSRLLPTMGRRVHTRLCNGYYVVKI